MPYQVKRGSLTIVAQTVAEAIKTYDAMSNADGDPVVICDMDGHEIDPNALRSAFEE